MADGTPALAAWPSPRLGVDEVHVWRIPLDDGPDPASERRHASARAARLRAQARAGLLRVLAHYTGLPAEALRFDVDALGKPRLSHAGAPSFNLSHARGLALVAVGAGIALGIDVEPLRPLADVDALAQRFLSPAEAAAVAATEAEARTAAFLRTWTRKEAALKASGHGLALDTRQVEVGAGPGDCIGSIADAAGTAHFRVLSLPLSPPWMGALAIAGARPEAVRAAPRVQWHELPGGTDAAPAGSRP